MIDPTRTPADDEQDESGREPELHTETLIDLTPDEDLADQVKGGITTGKQVCEAGTA
jgi:hypothetical protein